MAQLCRGVGLHSAARAHSLMHAHAAKCARRGTQTAFRAQRHLQISCQANRRRSSGGSGKQRRQQQQQQQEEELVRFKVFGAEVAVPQTALWMYGLPALAFLGTAAFIGPLVIAMAATALALGAAFSAGAMAFTALLFPLGLLLGLGGIFSFGAFGALGVALVLPKLILAVMSLAFVAGGLMLGFGGVNTLIAFQQPGNGAGGSSAGVTSDDDEGEEDDSEEVAARIADELEEFDRILLQKERAARADDWRGGGGRGL